MQSRPGVNANRERALRQPNLVATGTARDAKCELAAVRDDGLAAIGVPIDLLAGFDAVVEAVRDPAHRGDHDR